MFKWNTKSSQFEFHWSKQIRETTTFQLKCTRCVFVHVHLRMEWRNYACNELRQPKTRSTLKWLNMHKTMRIEFQEVRSVWTKRALPTKTNDQIDNCVDCFGLLLLHICLKFNVIFRNFSNRISIRKHFDHIKSIYLQGNKLF